MDIDWDAVSDGDDLSSIQEPASLFDALPNKHAGLGYLRQVQATVLDRWSPKRDASDLVIKMNTGTGKTIVGLLILQTSLHDEVGPALFLAPTPHLADRAAEEGRRLGLTIVTDPADTKFGSGEAICVTTLQKLFNGKSRFGLDAGGTPVKVGTIVVDDAHSAITRLEEYTRALIPRDEPAYAALLALFEADLDGQSAATLLDIKDGDRRAIMRIPFWSWQDKSAEVLRVLHPLRDTPMLEWQWPLLKDHLHICEATLTGSGLEISPPLPPVQKFPSFADAERRIYMTATLANDAALVTHFGADASTVGEAIVPDSASDLGDRLVLIPQELVPDLTDADLRTAVAAIAVTDNVVVLVPSWPRAREWSDVANVTVSDSKQIAEVVARLQVDAVGLVVIVNQYDGIDLPDEACRLLVIDGLPQAASGAEWRESTALRDSDTIATRQVQRFEQGMGRGVRSREDRCAVLVMDRRLVELISRPETTARLSPGTRAQVELSRRVARALDGRRDVTMDGIVDLIHKVIDGAEDFRSAARKALVNVVYETIPPLPTALPVRRAYDAAVRGDYEAAANFADAAVNVARREMNDERLAGWLSEKAAAYRHATDPARAQAQLSAASISNSSILRPISGLSFRPSRPTRRQAEAAAAYLTGKYTDGAHMRIGVEALIANLDWDPDRTEQAEQAWADLADHLGFSGQRPEKETGAGPDGLWSDVDGNRLVIEVKSGAETELISKRDINQLGGSVRWAEKHLTGTTSISPILVHPSHVAERTGTPPSDARSIDVDSHAALMTSLRRYATALAVDNRYHDASAVQEQLIALHFNGRQIAAHYGAVVRAEGS